MQTFYFKIQRTHAEEHRALHMAVMACTESNPVIPGAMHYEKHGLNQNSDIISRTDENYPQHDGVMWLFFFWNKHLCMGHD